VLLEVLRRFEGPDGYYVAPNVPKKKASNAAVRCELAGERVLALVDCTVFGSAKNCLVFGSRAIHYRNDAKAPVAGGRIDYADLPSRSVALAGEHDLALGGADVVEMSGAATPRERVAELLHALQHLVARPR
jgi:hypothetical protein